jgi:hypothetical protein
MANLELTDQELDALLKLVEHHDSVLNRQEPVDHPSVEHTIVRRLLEKIADAGGDPS